MKTIAIELAREAGLGFFRTCDSNETSVDALERFAKLIVKECARIALEESHEPSECILTHFGVKE